MSDPTSVLCFDCALLTLASFEERARHGVVCDQGTRSRCGRQCEAVSGSCPHSGHRVCDRVRRECHECGSRTRAWERVCVLPVQGSCTAQLQRGLCHSVILGTEGMTSQRLSCSLLSGELGGRTASCVHVSRKYGLFSAGMFSGSHSVLMLDWLPPVISGCSSE